MTMDFNALCFAYFFLFLYILFNIIFSVDSCDWIWIGLLKWRFLILICCCCANTYMNKRIRKATITQRKTKNNGINQHKSKTIFTRWRNRTRETIFVAVVVMMRDAKCERYVQSIHHHLRGRSIVFSDVKWSNQMSKWEKKYWNDIVDDFIYGFLFFFSFSFSKQHFSVYSNWNL